MQLPKGIMQLEKAQAIECGSTWEGEKGIGWHG